MCRLGHSHPSLWSRELRPQTSATTWEFISRGTQTQNTIREAVSSGTQTVIVYMEHHRVSGALLEEFGGCGPVKVEWPHRSRGGHVRRGPASDLHPGPPPRRHHHLPHGAFHNQAPKPEGVGDALGGGRLRLCYQGVPVGEELLFVCPSSV
ncbi:uncharacterized protein LOC134301262 isoform X4 [Trichomycterus rosablanca]|uniref:uncharacterized protein LOC134301262 isoform X4 n=1 Tax=Trichomycterus rosablanca TaxID=2290929 RepID=UPI002F35E99F